MSNFFQGAMAGNVSIAIYRLLTDHSQWLAILLAFVISTAIIGLIQLVIFCVRKPERDG